MITIPIAFLKGMIVGFVIAISYLATKNYFNTQMLSDKKLRTILGMSALISTGLILLTNWLPEMLLVLHIGICIHLAIGAASYTELRKIMKDKEQKIITESKKI